MSRGSECTRMRRRRRFSKQIEATSRIRSGATCDGCQGSRCLSRRGRPEGWAPMRWSLALLALALLWAAESSLRPASGSASIAGLQQSMAQLLQVFNGTQLQDQLKPLDSNHFRLLERDGDSLLLGARNVVYNLSLASLREQRRLEWPSSEEDVRMCRMKGKSADQCQNYIRVLKLQTPETLFVCGTNAYKPRCRTYLITSNAYELESDAPGEGACPYQESQNVTSLFADGDLYSATATQFSGIDGLIHRSPLRTEQFNPKQLNSPNFVSSFRYGEHIYFLFRESAIEHINCGKTIYSRIARVCINDSGGQTRANRERWTSFVKARLNCSIPGEFPFYFDEIQASTTIISSKSSQMEPHSPGSDLLYAVFTTPTNSIGGSAICAYRMSDVLAAFDGPFKSQADSNSNWLPVPESRVPQPRPGTCVNDSKRLPDENINFIKDNPLMDMAVEAIWSQPLIMMASINFRFTQIAVDAQVETQLVPGAASMRTDVIFVSTDDGRVFKLINTYHFIESANAAATQRLSQHLYPASQQPYYMAPSRQQVDGHYAGQRAPLASAQTMASLVASQGGVREPLPDVSSNSVVIEELHLFDSRTPIINMLIYYPTQAALMESGEQARPKLLVLSAKQLKAVPLSRCERALTCADCLALYDPYCAWDARQQVCFAAGRSSLALNQLAPIATPARGQQSNWFPPNNMANNYTFAWWLQCPYQPDSNQQQQSALAAQVGAPYRSLFSSHLQVPSRFDYASGHHLSHTALVSLASPANGLASYQRQQPVSECLTFCGGLYAPQPMASLRQSGAEPGSQQQQQQCADFVQQHYLGNLQSPTLAGVLQPSNSSLYTSENLYFAVIICAISGLLLGLVFGFAVGRSARKHDSSVCSSTFDETNLYMASTGSHNGANLFSQQQQQRLHHPLLQQASGTGLLATPSINGLRTNTVGHHLFDTNQCLLHDTAQSNYGNQQQLLLTMTSSGSSNTNNNSNSSSRGGALPPLPAQQAPLISTNLSSTLINHSQLTPNSSTGAGKHHQALSTSSASSTNTSSTSATVPANEHQPNQLYLNQQQVAQNLHQRSFTSGSANGSTTSKQSGLKNPTFLQQQQQQQQQQQLQTQQNNKIYL